MKPRRNPTTTTAGGTKRKTRTTTLARRMGRALGVDIATQSDGTARVVWRMRNGDELEIVAPTTYAAVELFEDEVKVKGRTRRGYRTSTSMFGSIGGLTVNGVQVTSAVQYDKMADEYLGRSFKGNTNVAYDRLLVYRVLIQAWAEALIDEPLVVKRAIDDMGKFMGRQYPTLAKYSIAMDALNQAMGGYGVEVIRSPEGMAGPYYRDVVAEYVNTGDTYSDTVVFNTESHEFERTSMGDWIEKYEREGGTVT